MSIVPVYTSPIYQGNYYLQAKDVLYPWFGADPVLWHITDNSLYTIRDKMYIYIVRNDDSTNPKFDVPPSGKFGIKNLPFRYFATKTLLNSDNPIIKDIKLMKGDNGMYIADLVYDSFFPDKKGGLSFSPADSSICDLFAYDKECALKLPIKMSILYYQSYLQLGFDFNNTAKLSDGDTPVEWNITDGGIYTKVDYGFVYIVRNDGASSIFVTPNPSEFGKQEIPFRYFFSAVELKPNDPLIENITLVKGHNGMYIKDSKYNLYFPSSKGGLFFIAPETSIDSISSGVYNIRGVNSSGDGMQYALECQNEDFVVKTYDEIELSLSFPRWKYDSDNKTLTSVDKGYIFKNTTLAEIHTRGDSVKHVITSQDDEGVTTFLSTNLKWVSSPPEDQYNWHFLEYKNPINYPGFMNFTKYLKDGLYSIKSNKGLFLNSFGEYQSEKVLWRYENSVISTQKKTLVANLNVAFSTNSENIFDTQFRIKDFNCNNDICMKSFQRYILFPTGIFDKVLGICIDTKGVVVPPVESNLTIVEESENSRTEEENMYITCKGSACDKTVPIFKDQCNMSSTPAKDININNKAGCCNGENKVFVKDVKIASFYPLVVDKNNPKLFSVSFADSYGSENFVGNYFTNKDGSKRCKIIEYIGEGKKLQYFKCDGSVDFTLDKKYKPEVWSFNWKIDSAKCKDTWCPWSEECSEHTSRFCQKIDSVGYPRLKSDVNCGVSGANADQFCREYPDHASCMCQKFDKSPEADEFKKAFGKCPTCDALPESVCWAPICKDDTQLLSSTQLDKKDNCSSLNVCNQIIDIKDVDGNVIISDNTFSQVCGEVNKCPKYPCKEDEVCVEGKCIPTITCKEGEIFRDGRCIRVTCKSNTDCQTGLCSKDGICINPESCDNCKKDEECFQGKCQKKIECEYSDWGKWNECNNDISTRYKTSKTKGCIDIPETKNCNLDSKNKVLVLVIGTLIGGILITILISKRRR
jgi:hypothetical protein